MPRYREVKARHEHIAERKKERRAARAAVRREREAGGLDEDAGVVKKQPRTQETQRDMRDTVLVDVHDAEVVEDVSHESALAVSAASAQAAAATEARLEAGEPKICVTTSPRPGSTTLALANELCEHVFYNAKVYARNSVPLEKIADYCSKRGFTMLVVIHERQRRTHGTGEYSGPTDLYVSGLPHGPTAHFSLRDVVLHKDIPQHGAYVVTRHSRDRKEHTNTVNSELILNGFTTRLGVTVAELLKGLFNARHTPDFSYRQVATFHCQRDFVFFRFHRWMFDMAETDAELRKAPSAALPLAAHIAELGPRMTLKLKTLRMGGLADKDAEFLFVRKAKNEKASKKKWAI